MVFGLFSYTRQGSGATGDVKGFLDFKFGEFFKEFPDAGGKYERKFSAQEQQLLTLPGSLNPEEEKPRPGDTLEEQSKLWDRIFTYVRHLRREKQELDAAITKLKVEHSRSLNETKQKDREIKRLIGQLLVNQDDHQAWPDDVLKKNFKELQLLIDSVTGIGTKEFVIPEGCQLESHLDPTNFVGRVGGSESRFLLRSRLWNIIHEQFFSVPFGFGSTGPGKSHEELMRVYRSWRGLLDGPLREARPETDSFSAFHYDVLANNWRSATFQSISVQLTKGSEDPSALGSPVAKLSADNVNHTISRLLGFLSDVSKLSGNAVTREVEQQIRHIARSALEIALQFGINPAQLRLSVPNRGEEVKIGAEYHHCRNADLDKGSVCVVDLVTLPGLLKIGDGRSDLSMKRVIVPCEIYPAHPSA